MLFGSLMGDLWPRQVHAMNATMMELSREMMKAGIIDEVRLHAAAHDARSSLLTGRSCSRQSHVSPRIPEILSLAGSDDGGLHRLGAGHRRGRGRDGRGGREGDWALGIVTVHALGWLDQHYLNMRSTGRFACAREWTAKVIEWTTDSMGP